MSSYYTTAELEELKMAQLKKELAESIQRLREQMQIKHANNVQITSGANVKTSVSIADNIISGYSKNTKITGDMLQMGERQSDTKRDSLDFSEMLFSMHKKSTKLEYELELWVKKADERPIITENDEKDRIRLFNELTKIIQSSVTDIEDKIKSVKMRVTSYLQCAPIITDSDKERIHAIYYGYCALCELLEVTPTEILPYQVEKEVDRMTAILEKRRQDEYIMSVIEEIMGDLGCNTINDAILDNIVGQTYSVDGHPLCDVFVGNDGSGIMFEPVGESKGGSIEKQRKIENSANSICSLYEILEERAAEKGVILNKVYIEPAHIGEMYVWSDISESSEKKKRRKTTTRQQYTLNSED